MVFKCLVCNEMVFHEGLLCESGKEINRINNRDTYNNNNPFIKGGTER